MFLGLGEIGKQEGSYLLGRTALGSWFYSRCVCALGDGEGTGTGKWDHEVAVPWEQARVAEDCFSLMRVTAQPRSSGSRSAKDGDSTHESWPKGAVPAPHGDLLWVGFSSPLSPAELIVSSPRGGVMTAILK